VSTLHGDYGAYGYRKFSGAENSAREKFSVHSDTTFTGCSGVEENSVISVYYKIERSHSREDQKLCYATRRPMAYVATIGYAVAAGFVGK